MLAPRTLHHSRTRDHTCPAGTTGDLDCAGRRAAAGAACDVCATADARCAGAAGDAGALTGGLLRLAYWVKHALQRVWRPDAVRAACERAV